MLPQIFAIIGAFIASLGGFYYLYETIIGKSKPNRITWLLWGIFPMITFIAQKSQGVQDISWVTFVSGFTPLLVFGASYMNKKSYWKSQRQDYYLMIGALLGIILWAITKNANIAILFSLLADFFAAIPTIIKCFKYPQSESWIAYSISTFGFALSILTIKSFVFQNYAFVIYLTIINFIMVLFASRKTVKT